METDPHLSKESSQAGPRPPDGNPTPETPSLGASPRVDWLTIALRNIFKNGRRSAFTISAIAFGFAAINLFAGFTRYIFSNLQETQIYLTGNGHLMVFKSGFNPNHLTSSQAQLLSAHELNEIRSVLKDDPRALVVTPKLVFLGLLSNGEESTPFIGIGKVIKDVNKIYARASGRLARISFSDGKNLSKEADAPPPPAASPPPQPTTSPVASSSPTPTPPTPPSQPAPLPTPSTPPAASPQQPAPSASPRQPTPSASPSASPRQPAHYPSETEPPPGIETFEPPPPDGPRAEGHVAGKNELVLARGLARKLNLMVGSRATAMATTVNGQVNALEAEVVAHMDAAMEMLDSMVIEAPLAFAQDLYDTDGADRMVILLERDADLIAMREELQRKLSARGLPLEVKIWYEVDKTTDKVEKMLRVIFIFLFTVFLIIALMSVVNTIGMAVTERTREIGTLRALGVKRRGIVTMFACESMLLGTLGSLAGVFLTLLGWVIVRIVDPHWTPPQIPKAIPLEIHLSVEHMAVTFVSLVLLSLVIAIWPASRAARGSIVDALGHV